MDFFETSKEAIIYIKKDIRIESSVKIPTVFKLKAGIHFRNVEHIIYHKSKIMSSTSQ